MDGKRIYQLAVDMTDKYGKRFCDMVGDDFKAGLVERKYFIDEFEWFELVGWGSFCQTMVDGRQGEWLNRINALDEQVLMTQMEKHLIDGIGKMDRETLDSAVKAIQGLVGRSKVLSEQATVENKIPEIVVKFIGSAGDPITGLAIKAVAGDTAE